MGSAKTSSGSGGTPRLVGIDHVQLAIPIGVDDPFGNRIELIDASSVGQAS